MNKFFNRKSALFTTLLFFTLLPPLVLLVSNLIKAKYSCFNGFDFGIYQQAITELSTFESLNPFVTIRGVKIFNDHFDPVIFFPALLVRLFGYSQEFFVLFEWFVFFIAPLLFLVKGKNFKSGAHILFCTFLYYFSRGNLEALSYPIHASFWSVPLWLWLGYSIIEKKEKEVIFIGAFLMLFKESIPFAIFSVSIGLLILRRKKEGVALFLISSIYLFFLFFIRPKIFGETVGYGLPIVKRLMSEPISYILNSMLNVGPLTLLKALIPSIFIIFVSYLNLNKERKKYILIIVLGLIPLFLIQLLALKFSMQYEYPFLSMSIGGFFSAVDIKKISKKTVIAIGALVFVTGFRQIELNLKFIFSSDIKSCERTNEKLNSINKVNEILSKYPGTSRILTTGGISQSLIKPGRKIYQINSLGDNIYTFDIIVLELKGSDIYPLIFEDIPKVIESCKPYVQKIELDNEYIFIATGNFQRSCYKK